jgi:hypothetical protein
MNLMLNNNQSLTDYIDVLIILVTKNFYWEYNFKILV